MKVAAPINKSDEVEGAAGFESFVRANISNLLRLALLITRNVADAEDLVQDTLMQTHRKWALVQRADDPLAYARRILVNFHLKNVRRGAPASQFEGSSDGRAAGATAAVDDRDHLRYALSGLPPRQRTALVLRYFLDLEDQEIARIMRCRRSTVRSHIRRGLANLRKTADNPNMEEL
jgi:RNA polymerase sigma-70 factor (sigma-E family)